MMTELEISDLQQDIISRLEPTIERVKGDGEEADELIESLQSILIHYTNTQRPFGAFEARKVLDVLVVTDEYILRY
jgi:hypothetical protein